MKHLLRVMALLLDLIWDMRHCLISDNIPTGQMSK